MVFLQALVCFCLLFKDTEAWYNSFQRVSRDRVLQTTIMETEETQLMTPTPKVPSNAWRWPPAWPFPEDFMEPQTPVSVEGNGYSDAVLERARDHLGFYLEKGMNVLEIAADGLSIISEDMSITVTKIAMTGVESNLDFGDQLFDAIIYASGIEYMRNPNVLYRESLRVLKPSGMCFTFFSSTGYAAALSPLKMWTTMNDEQKIWIAGAYYHYGGGDGYQNIEGYDLFNSNSSQMVFEEKTEEEAIYCVQAQKITLPPFDNIYNYTIAVLAGARHMDSDDKKLCAFRSEGRYTSCSTNTDKENLATSISKLDDIYAVMKDIKEVVIPKPIKAMLGVFMSDTWTNTEEEIFALKSSTGLITPNEEFWKPIGTSTGGMTPRDKINFLAHLVPMFGKKVNEAILIDFPTVLDDTITLIERKVPGIEKGDAQMLATDLTVSDYLSGTSDRSRFLRFLEASSSEFFLKELETRKQIW